MRIDRHRRKQLLYGILLLSTTVSLNAQYPTDIFQLGGFDQEPMEIFINIIPEDQEKNLYVIEWIDTIGQAEGYPKYNRPFELHCYIRDAKGEQGQYTGLSTQMTHCGFQSAEEEIEIYFMRRINPFFREDPDSALSGFGMGHPGWCDQSEFQPIVLPLKRTDRLRVILKNDPRIITLNYRSRHALNPDPMPHLGPDCGYTMVLAKHRYYYSRKYQKIRKGSQWVNRKGIEHTIDAGLVLIDPVARYRDRKQQSYTGWDLIRNPKLLEHQINFKEERYTPYDPRIEKGRY
jgi:hypothetical protein